MTARKISKEQFDSFNPVRQHIVPITEKSWFAHSGNKVVGTVFFDETDQDWAYAVLERDEKGVSRCIDVDSCITSQSEAEKRLIAAMNNIGA